MIDLGDPRLDVIASDVARAGGGGGVWRGTVLIQRWTRGGVREYIIGDVQSRDDVLGGAWTLTPVHSTSDLDAAIDLYDARRRREPGMLIRL